MSRTTRARVAVIGSGNIGTDLMIKVLRSDSLELVAFVGVDPDSDGLARARALGVPTTHDGVRGLLAMPGASGLEVVFDATSAAAHAHNAQALAGTGAQLVDLTPAALGPFIVPSVNPQDHLSESDVNMVTCGGQATVPIVAAVASVAPVHYAEIVATISSRSAGPGTRANIDEFTQTTARALEVVGGASRGKAIIVLNPADPPVMMRDTVLVLVPVATDRDLVRTAVERRVAQVTDYVPGYRLKRAVQFHEVDAASVATLVGSAAATLLQVTIYLEVQGAGDYLPAYAGNLDIMTSAALRVGELIAAALGQVAA